MGKRDTSEYALYRNENDELLCVGNRRDICNTMHWTVNTFEYYKSVIKKGTPRIPKKITLIEITDD